MKKKIAVAVSLLLVLALSVGGTIAWLTDSATVTNTFTIGNVNITLGETTGPNYKFVPGKTMAKDPTVTVEAGSEACYVFVKVDEVIGNDDNKVVYTSANQNVEKSFGDYFTYAIRLENEWTQGDGTNIPANVYYREYNAADGEDEGTESDAATYYILTPGIPTNGSNGANGVITVKDTVTKEMVDALNQSGYKTPQLTFTAYAIQKEGFTTAAAAWTELNASH